MELYLYVCMHVLHKGDGWEEQRKRLDSFEEFILYFNGSQQFHWGSHQHGQQQGHVSSTEDGEEDGVDHQQDVGGGQRGQQVDEAAQDQVSLVVVVLVEQVPVRHPAGHQLGDGLRDPCGRWQTHMQIISVSSHFLSVEDSDVEGLAELRVPLKRDQQSDEASQWNIQAAGSCKALMEHLI